jgi:hypothetical protein
VPAEGLYVRACVTYRAAVRTIASTSSAFRPFCAPRRFTSCISASRFTLTSGRGAASCSAPCSCPCVCDAFAGPAEVGTSDVEGVREKLPSVLVLGGAGARDIDVDVDGATDADTGVDGVAGVELSGTLDISSRLPLPDLDSDARP